MSRIFLLSPAKLGGPRTATLLRPEADFDLAVRLRQGSARLGEVYSFISGLYFRGKIAYASAFGSALVITPGRGLLPPETLVTTELLREFAAISIEEANPLFRDPLLQTAEHAIRSSPAESQFVLLGSVATSKYVEPLLSLLGERLLFPVDFVGRGDMSRGGLMLRSAQDGIELPYTAIRGAALRGARPAKLTPLPRKRTSPGESL